MKSPQLSEPFHPFQLGFTLSESDDYYIKINGYTYTFYYAYESSFYCAQLHRYFVNATLNDYLCAWYLFPSKRKIPYVYLDVHLMKVYRKLKIQWITCN